ncbi:lysyl oxidase homolog 4-like [Rhincodon typus]|uniref:lysyl oxidase homolog 4-like n=1 Tax=Rhincodon typus TaxID=259920 RepID=UPI002030D3A1|nr:lysyl oxidase homolog 4-like [Rhincodon typus]
MFHTEGGAFLEQAAEGSGRVDITGIINKDESMAVLHMDHLKAVDKLPGRRKLWDQKMKNPKARLSSVTRKKSFWIHKVTCNGNESHLSQCTIQVSAGKRLHPCENGMHAVISCVAGPAFTQGTGNRFRKAYQAEQPLVRLKGGAQTGEGRVEVLKNGKWGTVCDDRWNLLSASVVCRELGYGSAREALTGARLGQGQCHPEKCGSKKYCWGLPPILAIFPIYRSRPRFGTPHPWSGLMSTACDHLEIEL